MLVRQLLAAFVSTAMLVSPLACGDVVREGEGPRRAALNERELSPFPADAWSHLSEWTNGKAPSSSDLSGKPVLIMNWASWHPVSARAVRVATKVADQYAKEGLIVILVHDPEGWKEAEKPKAAAEGATLLVALDAKGEFRKAVQSDNNPDFYVIDRAGQLRFADITTESVEEAVKTVVEEEAEQAANVKSRLAKKEKEADRRARQTSGMRDDIDLTSIPEQPYRAPSPEAYERANMPVLLEANAQPQPGVKPTPRPFAMPTDGFFPSRPATNGRVIVAYFWHPDIVPSYAPVMDEMELLQRQKGRDVVVLGVLSRREANQNQPQNLNPDENDPAKVLERLQRMAKSKTLNHATVPDIGNAIFNSVMGQGGGTAKYTGGFATIVSSDGMLRWAGPTDNPSFRGALERVLNNDPGVASRRNAERAYIESKK
jgi:thiol-disulfide isomerase/thioredoxin